MGICDNKSKPTDDSYLTNQKIPGFFDITSEAKLDASIIIPGSSDGSVVYNNKIDPAIIPYLKYNGLDTGDIYPIATASAVIRTEADKYIVFYPSYHCTIPEIDGFISANVMFSAGDVPEDDTIGDIITKVPKNNVLGPIEIKDKVNGANTNTYTVYIVPTTTAMSGGAIQHGGAGFDNYKDLFADKTLNKATVEDMVRNAGDGATEDVSPCDPDKREMIGKILKLDLPYIKKKTIIDVCEKIKNDKSLSPENLFKAIKVELNRISTEEAQRAAAAAAQREEDVKRAEEAQRAAAAAQRAEDIKCDRNGTLVNTFIKKNIDYITKNIIIKVCETIKNDNSIKDKEKAIEVELNRISIAQKAAAEVEKQAAEALSENDTDKGNMRGGKYQINYNKI